MKRKASSQLQRSQVVRPKYRAALGRPVPAGRMAPMASNLFFNDIHYFDAAVSTDATTTTVALALNNMAAGDTIVTRDGNKILMKSLQLRVQMSLESAAVNQQVRMLVVYDATPTQSQATLSLILDAETMLGYPSTTVKSRFTILYDKVHVLNATDATALQKAFIKKYIKIPESCAPAVYGVGTASIPISGGLTFFYVGDTATGITDLNFSVNSRLTFVG